MSAVNSHPAPRELRSFGLIMAAMIAFWFGLLLPRLFGLGWPVWPWIVAALFAGLALGLPSTLRPVYIAWMYLGLVLGWINTRILLAAVFYLLITPMAWGLAMMGKDPLTRRLDRQAASYRRPSTEQPPEHMGRPY